MDYVVHSDWTSNWCGDNVFATASTLLYAHPGSEIQHPDAVDFRVLIAPPGPAFWEVCCILLGALCAHPVVGAETVAIPARKQLFSRARVDANVAILPVLANDVPWEHTHSPIIDAAVHARPMHSGRREIPAEAAMGAKTVTAAILPETFTDI